MTVRYFVLTVIIAFLLAISQVFIKLGLNKLGRIRLGADTFFYDLLGILKTNYFWFGGIVTLICVFIWMKVLSHVELSVAYPLISMSYIFGILFAKYVFKEQISPQIWIGTVLIVIGVAIINYR